jgi:hypothetical protein
MASTRDQPVNSILKRQSGAGVVARRSYSPGAQLIPPHRQQAAQNPSFNCAECSLQSRHAESGHLCLSRGQIPLCRDGKYSQYELEFISKYRSDGVVLPMGLRLAQLGR